MSGTVPGAVSYHLLKSIPVRRGSVSSLWSPGPSPSLGGHTHTCFPPLKLLSSGGCSSGWMSAGKCRCAARLLCPSALQPPLRRAAFCACAVRAPTSGGGGVSVGVFSWNHTRTHARTLLNSAYRSASPPVWTRPGYRSVPPARFSHRALPDAAAGEQWLPAALLLSIGNIHHHQHPLSV